MISFNDFIIEYGLQNKATSNIITHQVLPFLFLIDVGIYLRDGPFSIDLGNVSLQPFRGSNRVLNIHERFFDS